MNDNATTQPLDTWAVVELFGHKKLAGKVSEHVIGSATLIRIDIPETLVTSRGGAEGETTTRQPYTKLVGAGSIYCITPCSEEVARLAARQIERWNDPIPVELPSPVQIPARASTSEADFEFRDVGLEEDDDEVLDEATP